MKTIVITGATSFIGVHLIKEYILNNYNIIAVVRPNSKNIGRLPASNLITLVELDMNNIEQLVEKVKNETVNIFYHLAWNGVRMPYRADAELQENNYKCAVKAMNTARKLGSSIFIGSGSQAEYGKCIGKIDESYTAKPISEYGKFKLKAYKKLKLIAKKNNIKFIWARIFSVYGIYDDSRTLIMSTLDKMKKNEDIELTQCIQNWNFIYVEDVARILYQLAILPCDDGIYNIASDKNRKLKYFVIQMKKITNSKSELKFGAIQYDNKEIISFEPVINKLKKNLNYSTIINFEEGIKKILKFLN